MLDINGIKEKINEVTQLAESSHNQTAISLFNILKKDTAMQDIYDGNDGDDFERDLLDRCDEYAENETYHLDKAYQDIDWIRANGSYFNWEEIWLDWKDFCEYMDKPKAPEDEGKEWLEEEFDSYDVETIKSQLVVKLREFTELYQTLMENSAIEGDSSEDFVDYANRIVTVIGHLTKDYDKRDDTLDEIYNKGRSIAEDYTDFDFVREERYDEFRNLEDYLNDVNACTLMYYMYKEGRLKYATEIFQIVVKYVNDTFPSFTHEDNGKNVEQPKDTGKDWLEESVTNNDTEVLSKLKKEIKDDYRGLDYNHFSKASVWYDKVKFYMSFYVTTFKLNRNILTPYFSDIDDRIDANRENIDERRFQRSEFSEDFNTVNEFINDASVDKVLEMMNQYGRRDICSVMYDNFNDFNEKHDELDTYVANLNSEKDLNDIKNDTGKEWLDESVLMEMPATNYTSFEIEPYIICDTEYVGDDDEDTQYENPDAYVTPLSEYIDNTRNNPYWVREKFNYNREKPLCMTELNKNLNTEVVCIVGYPGYYDGMTVGIVAKEWDSDVMNENFTEFGVDNAGYTIYTMDMLHDDSQVFTEREAEQEWTRRVLEPEIEKAIGILIETQAIAGGRLYPSDMGYKAPKTSGEEFDESALYKKENLTETVRPSELPDPSWYDESMSVGDTLSYKYMGYPIFVECCRDDDSEDDRFYNLQIYLPDDKFSEDPIEEANFTYWNDMIYHLKEYVSEHPLNPNLDEPYIENKPEDEGNNWLEESNQLNENNEFEYWKNHEPIEANTSISFDYKGFHITVDNMEGDHFNVNIYKMINQPHNRNSIYPNINYSQYEFYAYSWSRIFDGIIAYVNRCSYDEPEISKKPKKSGEEFDEVLDIKGIKKQINEIVRMSDGNN